MYYFTADLHFGDDEIIEREARPFADGKEFEDVFVNNVNSVAAKEDTLYVIGDWINYNKDHKPDHEKAFAICRRIAASVILITGNNEQRLMEERFEGSFEKMKQCILQHGFADVMQSAYVEFSGERFFLTHHPKDHAREGTTLFGHTHRATGLWKPYGLNVCIDLNYFRPFSETEIMRLMVMKRDWWDTDSDCRSM